VSDNFYAILGVSKDATQDEIKKAYRGLARKFHPDKNPGNLDAENRFKEAAEAYRVLGDADLRAQYDRAENKASGASSKNDDAGDVFGEIFGTPRKQKSKPNTRAESAAAEPARTRPGRYQERGDDFRYELELEFEEAALGTEKLISIPQQDRCQRCGGTGAEQGTAPTICHRCSGTGTVKEQQGFFDVAARCGDCGGSGKMIPQNCRECGGKGWLEVERTISVRVPSGVSSGTRLKIRGEGGRGAGGGPPGDLIVVVDVKPHPLFEREEDDVVTEVPITLSTALLGGHIEVPTLEGKVRMRIPAGSQSGRVFRLKGKGFPSLEGRGRGDQRVRVVVEIPTYITQSQKELIEEFQSLEEPDAQPKVQDFQRALDDLYD
jgi:molecular chaperone DnaJ